MKNNTTINLMLFVFLFSIMGMSVNAQTPSWGDKFYESFDWANAAEVYEKYERKNPGNAEVTERIARCYKNMNDWEGAEKWYGKLYEMGNASPENIYLYGQALRSNMKYKEANEIFSEYISASASTTAQGIIADEATIKALQTANNFLVSITDINSPQADFSPIVLNDILFFTSDRTNDPKALRAVDQWNSRNFLELYMVDAAEAPKGSDVQKLSRKLNGKYHEGPVAFYPGTNEMYFTRSNYQNGKAEMSMEDINKLKIFKSPYSVEKKKRKDAPTIEEAVPFNSSEYSVGHATFNEDGSIMYFTSDMPGGFGLTDIWMCTVRNGQFGAPINLGPNVNTEGREMFPVFQNGMLYFASSGRAGLGGLDIYTTSEKNGSWSTPKNIGAPINSNYDDFALVFQDDEKGFFTSNRDGGVGGDDIYAFTSMGKELKILVYDNNTKLPLEGATVSADNFLSLISDEKGEVKPMGVVSDLNNLTATLTNYAAMDVEYPADSEYDAEIPMNQTDVIKFTVEVRDKKTDVALKDALVTLGDFESYTDDEGKTYWLIYPEKNYYLAAEKKVNTDKKYLSLSQEFSTAGVETPDEWFAVILLDYLEVGKEIEIEDIYYDLDKYFIRNDAAGELNEVVALMAEYPTMEIEMGSHTDCRASKAYNQKLSDNRAKAAMEYLVRNGVSPNRMTYKGYGESKLTNDCACECDKPISAIGLKAFRDCEDAQVANCSDDDHQANRRTTFKILKF